MTKLHTSWNFNKWIIESHLDNYQDLEKFFPEKKDLFIDHWAKEILFFTILLFEKSGVGKAIPSAVNPVKDIN